MTRWYWHRQTFAVWHGQALVLPGSARTRRCVKISSKSQHIQRITEGPGELAETHRTPIATYSRLLPTNPEMFSAAASAAAHRKTLRKAPNNRFPCNTLCPSYFGLSGPHRNRLTSVFLSLFTKESKAIVVWVRRLIRSSLTIS